MAKKVKLDAAQLALRAYAAAVNKLQPAYQMVFAFAQAEAKIVIGKYDERKAAIVAAFNVALDGLDNAADTLRVYLGDAIAVACKPDITVKVKADGAKIGEKATETLAVADVKRYADIRKLAAAARVALGVATKVAGSGKKKGAPEAPTADGVKAHFQKMVVVPEGRALLQKWAGEVGVWTDFKVQTETQPSKAETDLALRLAAKAADEQTALAAAARAAAAKTAKKGKRQHARA